MYHPFLIYPSAGDLDFAGPSTVSTIKLAKFTEATTAPSQVFGTTAPWSPGEMPREEDSSFEKHQEMLLNIQRIHVMILDASITINTEDRSIEGMNRNKNKD